MKTTQLLMTDAQRSVLGVRGVLRAYLPYGELRWATGPLLAYCGQVRDRVTRNYHLGNGYRVYSPQLMRFYSPDRLSPFGAGGINTYAYCNANPVNCIDPGGRTAISTVLATSLAYAGGRLDEHLQTLWYMKKFERNLKKMEPGTKINGYDSVPTIEKKVVYIAAASSAGAVFGSGAVGTIEVVRARNDDEHESTLAYDLPVGLLATLVGVISKASDFMTNGLNAKYKHLAEISDPSQQSFFVRNSAPAQPASISEVNQVSAIETTV